MTDGDLTSHHVAAHPFVNGLPAEDVEWFQQHATGVDFDTNDIIFRAGDRADAFYLIRTGLVALRLQENRIPGRIVQTLSEGSALGWSWLYPPHEWQFTAQAETPVRLLQISASDLRGAFESNPGLGLRVVSRVAATMAERLHAARRQLLDLSHG